jgi:hypothetical protein
VTTEEELREALVRAADDPAAEALTLGLSDRALTQARRQRRRRWGRLAAGAAVVTAAAVAAVFGLGGVGLPRGAQPPATFTVTPTMPDAPVGQSALIAFSAACTSKKGPQLARQYLWDPDTRRYVAMPTGVRDWYEPSPDGQRVLVVRDFPPTAWAAGDWSAAFAGTLAFHPITDGIGVQWSGNGTEVMSSMVEDVPGEREYLRNNAVWFYDPATGAARHSVPIPAAVKERMVGSKWSLQRWNGTDDSMQFTMLNAAGDRVEWLDDQGEVARSVTVHPGRVNSPDTRGGVAHLSPDGFYLFVENVTGRAVFDLRNGGRQIYVSSSPSIPATLAVDGWTGDHQFITYRERGAGLNPPAPAGEGHDPVYEVRGPNMELLQQAAFTLPSDPTGRCSTYPTSWGSSGLFPGAFTP